MNYSACKDKISRSYLSILICMLAVLLLIGCRYKNVEVSSPTDGFVDLSTWNFKKNGVVSLKKFWIISEDVGLSPVKSGSVFYKLTIKLPQEPDELAIKLMSGFNSFRLERDGRLLLENGIGPNNEFNTIPRRSRKTTTFRNDRKITKLTVWLPTVPIDHDAVWNEFYLGTPEQIEKLEKSRWILGVFLFGAIVMMALYHFTLFALWLDNRSILYFGLFCVLIAIRFLYSNGTLFSFILSGYSTIAVFRLSHIVFFLTIPCFGLFYVNLFPSHLVKKFILVINIIALLFTVTIFFQSRETILISSLLYQFLTICYSLVFIYLHVRSIAKKEDGSVIFAVGFLVLILSFINDSLFYAQLVPTFELTSWGVFVFILIQSFLLSRQFSSNYRSVKVLTEELRNKNVKLQNLDKLKDQFLANTSHELRTPLNGIIGITDSLINGVAGKLPQAVTGNLSMVVSSAKRLSGLINDILDYSKLENKNLSLHRKAVDIRSVAETVIAVSRQLIIGKDLVILNRIPGNLDCVNGDENRLQQILYNLVGNAVKFTNRGQIVVSARQKRDCMELSVTDTGPGIPESSFELIFQSFKQQQQEEASTSEGTGLGLSITKKLVELHKGKIWVESKPGQGATFYFTLPLADKKAVAERKSDSEKTGEISQTYPKPVEQAVYQRPELKADFTARQDKVQVLVVDDEPVNLQVVANFLALEQISFQLITSGKKLIEQLNKGPKPDVVLLDIMMPEMTGYEVCRLLREEFSSAELPIIMMTAKNRLSDLVEGFESGANDYLTKPFAKDELLARIKSQLDIKKAYETLEENLELKKELKKKEQDQQRLLMIQRKLSDLLNTVPDAMIAVNEDNLISFLNQSFLNLTGYSPDDLLGKPCLSFFQEKGSKSYPDFMNHLSGQTPLPEVERHYHHLLLRSAEGKTLSVKIVLTPLEMEDEHLSVLIFRREPKSTVNDSSVALLQNSLAIINELNQNRTRIQTLEESLIGITTKTLEEHPELRNDLNNIDKTLERMTGPGVQDNPESIPEKVVAAMKLAVSYWIECKGTSKLDLAKCSNLWKIHSDANGWERARTLDKYLDIETCPKKPRLEQVINTIYFVLGNCNTESPQRDLLEKQLTGLTKTIK